MQHPVFFSFAGDSSALVNRIKSKFRDDLVYMYMRTGVAGDNFPEEILSELSNCQLFVVFWSAMYVAGDSNRPWCRRELLTALRRLKSQSLRQFLIIQTDVTPLDQVITDPDTGAVVDGLAAFRESGRAFSYPIQERAIEQRLSFELAKIDQSNHPLIPRVELQDLMRKALSTGDVQSKSAVTFVAGFHGAGRRTLIHLITDNEYRHLTCHSISLDSIDGPEDLLRSIWGDVLHKSRAEQRAMMRKVQENPQALRQYYSQLSAQLVENRCYVIVSKDDSIDVSEVLPFWVPEYLGLLPATVQPLIFVTVGRPVPEFMAREIPNAGHVHVPSLEEHESYDMANRVIAAVDPSRTARWKPHIAEIVAGGANNAKLIVDIVKVASRRATLDFLSRDIASETSRFDQRVQLVVEWAWESISENPPAIQLLDVINLLGVVHIDSLHEIFKNSPEKVGDLLFRLIEIGLVEHLSESTYRIPRALARKLNFHFAGSLPRRQSTELIQRFARSLEVGTDEDSSSVVLNNRLQAQLTSDVAIDAADVVFITASLLFKSGWQRYRLGQSGAALSLFRRSFGAIEQVRDDATKLEIVRYFGLAAAREQSENDVAAAVRYLSHAANLNYRFEEKAKSMALFIQGFAYKCDSKYTLALPKYEEALKKLPDERRTEHQRSQMLNEAVQCILRIEPVNIALALQYSRSSVNLRENPNNIDVLLRSLLARTYFDQSTPKEEVSRNLADMNYWESILKTKSETGGLSFYDRRRIDRLEAEAMDAVLATGQPFPSLDLTSAISLCHDAYQRHHDDAILWRKWDLMFRTEIDRDWTIPHKEATEYLEKSAQNKIARLNAARIRILTFNRADPSQMSLARSELEKYRTNGTLPPAVVRDIHRYLVQNERVLRVGLWADWDL